MKKKITWTIEERKLSDLKGAEYNPRTMTEQEERDLEASVEEFGEVVPLVINTGKRANYLIGGHQRTKLYTKKGIETVKVAVPSRPLTLTEEKELNLRLNKNTGSWDNDKLKDMGLELLLEVGFGDEDLQMYFDDVDMFEDEFNVGRAIREIKVPKAKPGDVYELGGHRLMCGNALDVNDVHTLMNGELADVVFCDPPTKVTEEGHILKPDKEKKDKGKYTAFINQSIENALQYGKPNCHVFFWCLEKDIWIHQSLFHEHKLKTERVLIWIKDNMQVAKNNAFNRAYEPVVYGTRGNPYINEATRNLNEILNKEIEPGNQVQEDIWEKINLMIDKREDVGAYTYPGQKPVTLMEKPLKRCTAPGHIVLDLFGGSGSTMIAAEQLGRKAYIMEKDPIMVDVMIQRWEEVSNHKAKKV